MKKNFNYLITTIHVVLTVFKKIFVFLIAINTDTIVIDQKLLQLRYSFARIKVVLNNNTYLYTNG